MSTVSQNIFRMIKQGMELRILLTDSEDYDFGKKVVYPAHVCFTDISCFPYRKETAHHKKDEIKLMVNQRQKRGYLLECTKLKGFGCKIQNVMNYPVADGKAYYAFLEES